jgi:hypothetical protein
MGRNIPLYSLLRNKPRDETDKGKKRVIIRDLEFPVGDYIGKFVGDYIGCKKDH